MFPGSVSELFAALGRTLAFRRWGLQHQWTSLAPLPAAGSHYRYHAGSVLRVGRIVAVTRPVGLTLKEALHDPPCRVMLTLRWHIDPVLNGSSVRLHASYRLNHAARLRGRHWDRRLQLHFSSQFSFVALNLERLRDDADAKRDPILL